MNQARITKPITSTTYHEGNGHRFMVKYNGDGRIAKVVGRIVRQGPKAAAEKKGERVHKDNCGPTIYVKHHAPEQIRNELNAQMKIENKRPGYSEFMNRQL